MALNQADFNRLVEDHGPTLYRMAYRMIGDQHEAEDMVQETFRSVWKSRARYEAERGDRAWLVAILALTFGARTVVWPLQRLARAAGRVSWGDLSAIGEPVGGVTLSPARWIEATENSVAHALVDGAPHVLQKASKQARINGANRELGVKGYSGCIHRFWWNLSWTNCT